MIEGTTPEKPVEVVPVPTAPTVELNIFGRPREYNPAYHLTQTQLYIDNPGTTITVRDWRTNEATKELLYKSIHIPTIEGLAAFMKVGRNTIYEWAKVYPDFRDIIEQLQTQQAQTLLENGLTGQFNSTITKLMLGKHGYKDQTDLTTNNKDITPENQSSANAAIVDFLTKKDGKADTSGNTQQQ